MLTEYQVELIHREIDGENTPEASAEVRELVASQAEAMALMTSLQSLDALFREVPYREAPPMSLNPRPSPNAGYAQGTTQTINRWATRYARRTVLSEPSVTRVTSTTTSAAARAATGPRTTTAPFAATRRARLAFSATRD